MKYPPLAKPQRGIYLAGPYSVRFFSTSYRPSAASDAGSSGDNGTEVSDTADDNSGEGDSGGGDVWDYGVFEAGDANRVPAGSLIVFVGDVTGHGAKAAILARRAGLPVLFRACLSRQLMKGRFSLAKLRNEMDRELAKVLPLGVTVQSTFAFFVPHNEREGDSRAVSSPDVPPASLAPSIVQITPDNALVARRSSVPDVHWLLAKTAHLLGLSWLSMGIPSRAIGIKTEPFPDCAELALATDGLFDQSTASGSLLSRQLVVKLPTYRADLPLIGQLIQDWNKAVQQSGQQDDDMLVVSIRHTTDEEMLVFRVLAGDQQGAGDFYRKYHRLIGMLARKLVGDAATLKTHGEQIVAPGVTIDELVHDAMCHVILKLPKWYGGNVVAWIKIATVNFVRSQVRKWSRQLPASSIGPDTPDPTAFDPELSYILDRAREKFRPFLAELPEKEHVFLKTVKEVCRGESVQQRVCEKLKIPRRTFFDWQTKLLRRILLHCFGAEPSAAVLGNPGGVLCELLLLLWPSEDKQL